jgi:MFS family permease
VARAAPMVMYFPRFPEVTMSHGVTAAASVPRDAAGRRGLVLVIVLAGATMAILDVAIVNVAIPSIRADLHAGFGAIELVISGYTITYACPLVPVGRLGDLYGRKCLFIVGILSFALASALCGAAPSAGPAHRGTVAVLRR